MIGFNECELSVVEDSETIGISVQLLHGSLEGSVELLVTPIDRTARSKWYCVACISKSSYIRPLLEYAVPVWDPHTASNSRVMENVQKNVLERVGC